jgi:hypothetical protein
MPTPPQHLAAVALQRSNCSAASWFGPATASADRISEHRRRQVDLRLREHQAALQSDIVVASGLVVLGPPGQLPAGGSASRRFVLYRFDRREQRCPSSPGSHHRARQSTPFSPSRTVEVMQGLDPEKPAMRNYPEQVTLKLQAGDAVAIDYRLLHGTHARHPQSAEFPD